MSLGCNSSSYVHDGEHISALAEYEALGTKPGFCHQCHTGKCPVGVTTKVLIAMAVSTVPVKSR